MTVAADPRKPRVELRRRRRADGSVSVKSTVRWTDLDGTRRRRGFDTFEEADLERARLALELAQTGTIGGIKDNTLAALWPIYRADAVARLAEATIISYDRCWSRHLSLRFGDVPLDEITPRSVAQWRADMLAKGIGRETVRRAMVLLQAMFTLGVEWGEAERNPVSVVRKPRQGRLRAIEVLDPATVEAVRRALLASGDYFSATLVSVLAYAGVRPGEAIGLERRHIREDTILVEQAVSYGKLKLQKTGRVYRTVDLLPELCEDIGTWCDMKDITRPDTPLFGDAINDIVLTRTDYARVVDEGRQVFDALGALSLTSTILFVGYSLDDPDIQLVLQAVGRRGLSPEAHFMLSPQPSSAARVPVFKDSFGVSVLTYTAGEHALAEQAITELGNLVLAARPGVVPPAP